MAVNRIVRNFSTVTKKISLHNRLCTKVPLEIKATKKNLQFQTIARNFASQVNHGNSLDITRKQVEKAFKEYNEESRNHKHEILFEPYEHSYLLSTENVAAEFVDAFNYWMNLSEEDVQFIKEFSYMLYEAIALIDDPIDDSDIRRGFPTPHRVFGMDRGIVSGVSVFLEIIRKLHNSRKPETVEIFCKSCIDCYSSIAQHLRYNKENSYPTREEYMKLSLGKTSYYWIIIRIMQSFSDCTKDFSRVGATFGIYCQALSDTNNFLSEDFSNFKVYGEDISSGNQSFPIILVAEKNKSLERNTVLNIVQQRTKDPLMVKYCADIIEKLGVLEESKKLTLELCQIVQDESEKLGGNPKLVEILAKMNNWGLDEKNSNHPKAQVKKST